MSPSARTIGNITRSYCMTVDDVAHSTLGDSKARGNRPTTHALFTEGNNPPTLPYSGTGHFSMLGHDYSILLWANTEQSLTFQ